MILVTDTGNGERQMLRTKNNPRNRYTQWREVETDKDDPCNHYTHRTETEIEIRRQRRIILTNDTLNGERQRYGNRNTILANDTHNGERQRYEERNTILATDTHNGERQRLTLRETEKERRPLQLNLPAERGTGRGGRGTGRGGGGQGEGNGGQGEGKGGRERGTRKGRGDRERGKGDRERPKDDACNQNTQEEREHASTGDNRFFTPLPPLVHRRLAACYVITQPRFRFIAQSFHWLLAFARKWCLNGAALLKPA